MKRNVLVVMNTCARVFMVNGTGRYVNVPKRELINTCLSSVVNSLNLMNGHTARLVIFDDHSSDDAIHDISVILKSCTYQNELIRVEDGTGIPYMLGKIFNFIGQETKDLWYHVEDDYLHRPESMQDMLDTFSTLERDTNKLVAINPHDDVWRYRKEIYPSFLLLGPHRHYRTVKHSTATCLSSKRLYDKYSPEILGLSRWSYEFDENKSINLVWNRPDVMLFSPIPGLAFHISEESTRDPYVDVMKLWNNTPKLWK